ncbi:MAG: NADH:flavin oxidoreductase [Spirochaetaceae bacterium]|nr:NADH:flavin oxidoreductase [Spirochaetaceae bacterium]
MAEFKRFNLQNIDDLKSELDELNLSLPINRDLKILGEKVEAGNWTLPNRFVVQPMEGIDGIESSSAPSDLTFRRYARYARGGAGLIWFEAAVVEPAGKSNPRQLMLTKRNLDIWKRLVEETRQAARDEWGHEIITVLQIAHSGRWSKPDGKAKPIIMHHNPVLDKALNLDENYPLITDSEIDQLKDLHIELGLLAAQAGFDGVEMKAVHGYFTGEMLCAHTRKGRYGGSYENRTRFIRESSLELADRFDSSHFVTARLTMYEPSAYPYGWGVRKELNSMEIDLSEPLRFAVELVTAAKMPLFNFSIGYPRSAPYFNRPFNSTVIGGPLPPEHPLEGIVRFQKIGRELQKALGNIPVATAALGWLRHLMPPVASGLIHEGWVQLIGQGRQSFAYPDSVKDILTKGAMDRNKCCLTCSMCSQIMKDVEGRNGCPVRDGAIYKQELQKGRKAAISKGLSR